MKKYIILSLFVALFSTSCSDELLTPETPGVLYLDEATGTLTDLDRLLNSAQAIMTDREEYVFTSIFTDEAAPGSNNGGQGIGGSSAQYLFFMNPSSPAASSIWSSNYNAMARVNLVLESLVDIPQTSTNQNTYNRIKAQALTLRALGHLKVLAYYSTDLKDNSALAGIKADRTFKYTETPPRATNGEIYAFVHKDLDDAITLFSASPFAASSVVPTRNLARALKARAYAYKGDYINAEIFADLVIASSGVQVATAAQLPSVFHTHTSAATTEVIYKFKRLVQNNAQASNLHNGWVSVTNANNGSPFYEVSRALFNFMAPDFNASTPTATLNDARTFIAVRPSSATGSLFDPNYATATNVRNSDVLIPFKHGGAGARTSTNGFNPDFIQVRISEMHFIKAEARAELSDYPGIISAIKQVTDRRFNTAAFTYVTPTSKAQAFKLILDERRKEFAFEGHRFIDLKRLYSSAGVSSFDRHPADYIGLGFPGANPANFVFANNYKWALPVPFNEMNANSNIIQNPNY
jgi:hypothetical protein